jgi:hypothetical protein
MSSSFRNPEHHCPRTVPFLSLNSVKFSETQLNYYRTKTQETHGFSGNEIFGDLAWMGLITQRSGVQIPAPQPPNQSPNNLKIKHIRRASDLDHSFGTGAKMVYCPRTVPKLSQNRYETQGTVASHYNKTILN